MNVLHGMSEISGQGYYTVQGLRRNGITAELALFSDGKSSYAADIILDRTKPQQVRDFAEQKAKEIDIFHSHAGDTLLSDQTDLDLFKKNNVRIFAEFHGTEIRYIFNDIPLPFAPREHINSKERLRRQKLLLNLIGKSDGIILHSAGQYPYLPKPLSKPVYIVPLRVDIKKHEPQYETGHERLRIVHAPTNRQFKGTDRILRALGRVKEDFELVLVEGKTPEEALNIYRTADIIIDQISGGSYGVLSIEAMALGKPVIAYISEKTRLRHPLLPVVNADFDNLGEVVSSLISDKQRRICLGKSGREYVERYHENVRVTALLPELYAGKLKQNNLFDLL
ncbi:MAG: hypothetical protein K5770_04695 [Lachnospiraceae bacterium]|nr:hypothetical protein [Lachnospiraceae bacterium]